MFRTLTVATALLLGSVLQPVLALGLGELRLKSHLNQPFSAVIPITSLAPGEAESIRAELADNAAFARAGMERLAYLSTVDISVVTADSQPRIVLRSPSIAREPLIGLILEIRTSGGPRILREFTVLLDPPPANGAQVASDDSATDGTDATEATPAATPVPPAEPAAPAVPVHSPTYGPVKKGESLSTISVNFRPYPEMALGQVMSAFMAANPGLFPDGNFNNLAVGAVLQVPDPDTIRQTRDIVTARIAERPAPPPAEPAGGSPDETTQEEGEAAEGKAEPEAAPEPDPESEIGVDPEPSSAGEKAAAPPPNSAPAAPAPPPGVLTVDEIGTGPVPASVASGAAWVRPLLYPIVGLVALLLVLSFLRASHRRKVLRKQEEEAEREARLASQVPLSEQVLAGRLPRPAPAGEEGADSPAEPGRHRSSAVVPPSPAAAGLAGAAGTVLMSEGSVVSRFDSSTTRIDLDSDDPLAEAEFHQAYGLFDEAALMLQQALAKQPDRSDLSLKLAEIYYAAGRPTEFLQIAERLRPRLGKSDWVRIATMGKELFPTSALFAEAVPPAPDPATDLGAAGTAPVTEPGTAVRVDDGLSFSIEELELPLPEPRNPDADSGLDFDLGEFDLGDAEVRTDRPMPETVMDRRDFDLADGGGKGAEDQGLELDLGDIELLDFQPEPDSDVVGTGDDHATSLDLARAYVEMGDATTARSLLEHVTVSGSDEQKREAAQLLRRLAGK
ncbi:MAG: FimV/HubP family polar landmark protein [Panacagrimonas sp.]